LFIGFLCTDFKKVIRARAKEDQVATIKVEQGEGFVEEANLPK
jgi:hypothetical protein